jgi:hypothetical protein
MAALFDISHLYGEDLGTTPSGDIAVVSNHDRTVQRVIRRLLTSGYVWEQGYGAGLLKMIGEEETDPGRVQAIVLSQLLIEPTVARTPLPTVTVTEAQGTGVTTITIVYTDLSGTPQSFAFDLA